MDNTTLITGIDAVVKLSSMPGKKPIIAGKPPQYLEGYNALSFFKVFAYTAIGIIKPAKNVSGINKRNKVKMNLTVIME